MARFIDEAIIQTIAGKGGPGAVAFRREKFEPRGGPAGGDGGKGGDVWIVAAPNLSTLLDLRYRRTYEGGTGKGGAGGNKAGPDGADLEILLPIGSIITDADTGDRVGEVTDETTRILVAKGGRGGKGNTFFKTSTHQAPRYAQPGEEGETRRLKVELKLLADVGLVGYPNAGKSTLISKVSAARPKIASYPFTTLVPNLGVVRLGHESTDPTFVIADIPGLIEGASLGRGLGTKFLKHLDRTRMLIHLIDGAKLLKELGDEDPKAMAKAVIRDKEIIDAELYTFSADLSTKPQILAFNKADLYSEGYIALLKKALAKLKHKDFYFISGAAHLGLDALLKRVAEELSKTSSLKGGRPTQPLMPHEVPKPQ